LPENTLSVVAERLTYRLKSSIAKNLGQHIQRALGLVEKALYFKYEARRLLLHFSAGRRAGGRELALYVCFVPVKVLSMIANALKLVLDIV
jgi:hypothetical protein